MREYEPLTLRGLAVLLANADGDRTRWKLVWEFLEEHRWESAAVQPGLLADEPESTGDERWDALLAALAEHLAAQHDLAPPAWAEHCVLRRAWFPAELAVQRADAIAWAPAAFRKHGVYLPRQAPGLRPPRAPCHGGVTGPPVRHESPRRPYSRHRRHPRPRHPYRHETVEAAIEICADFFPEETLPPRALGVLEELFGPAKA